MNSSHPITWPRALVRAALRAYQVALAPWLGGHCRFYPSCSQYALEAVATHGAARGLGLTLRRLLKCHPLHPGGVDLVPPARPAAPGGRCFTRPTGVPTP